MVVFSQFQLFSSFELALGVVLEIVSTSSNLVLISIELRKNQVISNAGAI